jgi:hypothetical protein
MTSQGQRFGYVFIGFLIGMCLSVGAWLGLANYAPSYLLGWQKTLTKTELEQQHGLNAQIVPESNMIKSIIQDILTSEQGKAIVNELIQTQGPEILKQMLEESINSPEFRATLGKAINTFLKTPEGKQLIKQIANEILTP